MKQSLLIIAGIAYELAAWATFGKLTFFDDYHYNWYNWMIVLPMNTIAGQFWPFYWAIVRPIFGH